MEEQNQDVNEIVERMKATARAHASPPLGPATRECYHEFATGLRLCLTVDVLTREWIGQVGRLFGVNFPREMATGRKLWHLSIARVGAVDLTGAEVEFWRRAFFEEPPWYQSGGGLPGVHSRHFFWSYEEHY